jgi:hypothetical protein
MGWWGVSPFETQIEERPVKFTAILRIHPQGVFGVPDEAKIVLPVSAAAQPRTITLATFDADTLREIAHGTMPEFRPDAQALKMSLNIPGGSASLVDNFLTFVVEANSASEAVKLIRQSVTSLLRRLEIQVGTVFWYERVKMTSATGVVDGNSEKAGFGLSVYNLSELKVQIQNAQAQLAINDPTFEHGLFYLEHAMLLVGRLGELTDRFNEHADFVYSEAFLHAWKAITLVLGDTTRQSPAEIARRARVLGLASDYYSTVVEPLTRIRHNSDGAHSTPDDAKVKDAQSNLGTAISVARSVLQTYAKYRGDGGAPFAP